MPTNISAAETAQNTFEFLYINANEDQASGGHSAVRIDDFVFHFQYEDGLLKITRDTWFDFQLSYRGFQNRTIYGNTLDITPPVFNALKKSFHQFYLNEQRKLSLLSDAKADARLAKKLLAQTPVSVSGAGFFHPPTLSFSHLSDVSESGVEGIVGALRRRVIDTYGEQYLQQRIHSNRLAMANLRPQVVAGDAHFFESNETVIPAYTFHERYGDQLSLDLALRWLSAPTPINEQQLIRLSATRADFRLSLQDRIALQQVQDDLLDRLVHQAGNRYSDWGHSFLLGAARLVALQLSLDSGYWVSLNIMDKATSSYSVSNRLQKHLPAIGKKSFAGWQQSKTELLQLSRWKETLYLNFEGMSNQLFSVQQVLGGLKTIHIRSNRRVPSGEAMIMPVVIPEIFKIDQGREVYAAMIAAEKNLEVLAKEHMSYSLLADNCVSELFQLVNVALLKLDRAGLTDQPISRVQRDYLGGEIDVQLVPFIADFKIKRNWRISARTIYPSSRNAAIEELYRQNSSLWVLFRESNTLGSTIYLPSENDSIFLFFTDQRVWSRPLFGLLNIVTGASAVIGGVFSAPFDGGETIKKGVKGVFFSLPELVFFNIRKGTNVWVSEPGY